MVVIPVIKKIELRLRPPNELLGKCSMPEGGSWLLVTIWRHPSCPLSRFAQQLGSCTFSDGWQQLMKKQGPLPFRATWARFSPNKPEYQNPSDIADVCKVAHPLSLYLLQDRYGHIPRLIMWRILETSKTSITGLHSRANPIGTFVKKE